MSGVRHRTAARRRRRNAIPRRAGAGAAANTPTIAPAPEPWRRLMISRWRRSPSIASAGNAIGEVHCPVDHRAVPRAHRCARPARSARQRRDRAQSRCARHCRRTRRRAQGQGPARPDARDPGADQGQHRDAPTGCRRPRARSPSSAARRHAMRSSSSVSARPGAVILGKTNLSEWANFRSTHSSSGWSGRGGQTRNPYALDRNAVRLELGLGGRRPRPISARSPSAPKPTARSSRRRRATSLVGLKPTVGSLSRAGIVPISHSQDTAGPMGRTVRDAAILLGAMTGVDARDPATAASQGASPRTTRRASCQAGSRGATRRRPG